MNPQEWLSLHTFHHSAYSNIRDLLGKKNELGYQISVAIPTLNEEETIGDEVRSIRENLQDRYGLVDEILVIDSGSTDQTRSEALEAGAAFYPAAEILPQYGSHRGKGENLWKSLWVARGDIIVWLDADIKNIAPKFVYGLLGPLLEKSSIGYVKAFYNRPLKVGEDLRPTGGGRVTEILVRPLLNLVYPELAYLMQPLSGEYAGKREVLEKLDFSIGYGVEIGHLLDLYAKFGLEILGQVDLDMRVHRNRPIQDLGKMSFGILQTFFSRVAQSGRLRLSQELEKKLIQFQASGTQYQTLQSEFHEILRPAMEKVEGYEAQKQFLRKNKGMGLKERQVP